MASVSQPFSQPLPTLANPKPLVSCINSIPNLQAIHVPSSISATSRNPSTTSLQIPFSPNPQPVIIPVDAHSFSNPSVTTTWSSLVCRSCKTPVSRVLEFVEPTFSDGVPIASCKKSEVEKASRDWEGTLFGFILGKRAYLPLLKKVLLNKWKILGSLELISQAEGAFMIKFGSVEEKLRVLEQGPWFVSGRLLVLKPWRKRMKKSDFDLSFIPIWIRLPNLPLEFWSKDSLSRIGSLVGKPLFLDDATANQSRTGFARLCVEVSAVSPVPKELIIDVEGSDVFKQGVQVEWCPPICATCKQFHSVEQCSAVIKHQPSGKSAISLEMANPGDGWKMVSKKKTSSIGKVLVKTSEQQAFLSRNSSSPVSFSVSDKVPAVGVGCKEIDGTEGIVQDVLRADEQVSTGGVQEVPTTGQKSHQPSARFSFLAVEPSDPSFLAGDTPEDLPIVSNFQTAVVSPDISGISAENMGFLTDLDGSAIHGTPLPVPRTLPILQVRINECINSTGCAEPVRIGMVNDIVINNISLPTLKKDKAHQNRDLADSFRRIERVDQPKVAGGTLPLRDSAILNYFRSENADFQNRKSSDESNQTKIVSLVLPSSSKLVSSGDNSLNPIYLSVGNLDTQSLVDCSSRKFSSDKHAVDSSGILTSNPSIMQAFPCLIEKSLDLSVKLVPVNCEDRHNDLINREANSVCDEEDRDGGPPGFNCRMAKSLEENSLETAIHITEETSSSEEEVNGFSGTRAKMIREKLGISVLGTDNTDKAFAEFCRNRQKEIDVIRKKSAVPDVSIKLKNHVGKKGFHTRRIVEGGKKKVRS